MSNINSRILDLITDLGLSKNQFAIKINTSSAMISKVTNQKTNFGKDIVEKIINAFPDLNTNWLFTGLGEMWQSKADKVPTRISHSKKLPYNYSDKDEQAIKDSIQSNMNMLWYLYQRIVDVRLLQQEKLNTGLFVGDFAKSEESKILNELTSVDLRTKHSGETVVGHKHDAEDLEGKIKINEDLEKAISDFYNIFFKEFRTLYLGLRDMDENGLQKKK